MTTDPAYVLGDRVRTIAETWGKDTVPIGATGTVTQTPPLLAVAFDHDPIGDGTGSWAMFERNITHLTHTPADQARLRNTDGHNHLILIAITNPTIAEAEHRAAQREADRVAQAAQKGTP